MSSDREVARLLVQLEAEVNGLKRGLKEGDRAWAKHVEDVRGHLASIKALEEKYASTRNLTQKASLNQQINDQKAALVKMHADASAALSKREADEKAHHAKLGAMWNQASATFDSRMKQWTAAERAESVKRREIAREEMATKKAIWSSAARSQIGSERAAAAASRQIMGERANMWRTAAANQAYSQQQVVKSQREAAKQAAVAAASQQRSLNGITRGFKSAERAALGYARRGAFIAATATGLIGLKAIKTAGAFEQADVAFTHMLGSGAKSKRFLEELKEFAATTPFEFVELQDQAKRLMAVGFEAKEVLPTLAKVGDAVASLGLDNGRLNRVVLALSQMRNAAKVSAQDMRQLTEAGIPAWKMLEAGLKARGTKVNMGQLIDPYKREKIKVGGVKLDGEKGFEIILEQLGKRYKGMMKKQSSTLLGLWSNFKDRLTYLLIDIGDEIIDRFDLKDKLKSMVDKMKTGELTEEIMKVVDQFVDWGETIGHATAWLWKNRDAIIATSKAALILYGTIKAIQLVSAAGSGLSLVGGLGSGAKAMSATGAGASSAAVGVGRLSGAVKALGVIGLAVAGSSMYYDLYVKPQYEADLAAKAAEKAKWANDRYAGGVKKVHDRTRDLIGAIKDERDATKRLEDARKKAADAFKATRGDRAKGIPVGKGKNDAANMLAQARYMRAQIEAEAAAVKVIGDMKSGESTFINGQGEQETITQGDQINNNIETLRNRVKNDVDELNKLNVTMKERNAIQMDAWKKMKAGIYTPEQFLEAYEDADKAYKDSHTAKGRNKLEELRKKIAGERAAMKLLADDLIKTDMANYFKKQPNIDGKDRTRKDKALTARDDLLAKITAETAKITTAQSSLKTLRTKRKEIRDAYDAIMNDPTLTGEQKQAKVNKGYSKNGVFQGYFHELFGNTDSSISDATANLKRSQDEVKRYKTELGIINKMVTPAQIKVGNINKILADMPDQPPLKMEEWRKYMNTKMNAAQIAAAVKRDRINATLKNVGQGIKASIGPWASDLITSIQSAIGTVKDWIKGNPIKLGIDAVMNFMGIRRDSPFGSTEVPKGLAPQMGVPLGIGRQMGLTMTSGFRPGAVTSSGKKSDHSTGHAIDMAGSASKMAAFYRVAGSLPGLKQRIYSPLDGWSNDHYDHVHVAMKRKGGFIPGSSHRDTVPALLTKGEYVFTREAVKNAGGPQALDSVHSQLQKRGANMGQERRGDISKFRNGGYIGEYNQSLSGWNRLSHRGLGSFGPKGAKLPDRRKLKKQAMAEYWPKRWDHAQGFVQAKFNFADLKMARAETTPGLADDKVALRGLINHSLRAKALYSKYMNGKAVPATVKDNARAAVTGEIRNLKDLRTRLAEMLPDSWADRWSKAKEKLGSKYGILDLALARAEGTETKEDDKAALLNLIKHSMEANRTYEKFANNKKAPTDIRDEARGSIASELRNIEGYREQIKNLGGSAEAETGNNDAEIASLRNQLRVSRGAFNAFTGSGDIGYGLGNTAFESAGGQRRERGSGNTTIVVQSLTGYDPTIQDVVANANNRSNSSGGNADKLYTGRSKA